ncbi:MAG: EutN/CcmL family microcompartment protein [Kiritimatiellae bacterium]|nr:EutN/CcmL family microcompartment protein [Kiritimatiellia bacterium]MCO5061375.1 EutN/CcmL family microcompartment protein [Kiritimatiellia bacterium]MCO6400376.1 EutN/CcmL family microcompartment protein [Verrucomicrobiota bacterium]
MFTGRVIGHIDSTINHPWYDAKKLLVVEKTDASGKAASDYVIAVDTVGAGVGEPVLVLDEGNGARQIVASSDAPVRSVIVGIIDEIHCPNSGS